VELCRTNDEVLTALDWASFDVIVSNMRRDGTADAGLRLIQALQDREMPAPPVILYVSNLQPGTPPGVFGITNRPDELYHLLLDVLERRSKRRSQD
jgi:hypothetical protein